MRFPQSSAAGLRRLPILVFCGLQALACQPETETVAENTPRTVWGTHVSLFQVLEASGDSRAELQALTDEGYSERAVALPVGEIVTWTVELPAQPSRLDFGLWIEDLPKATNDAFVEVAIDAAVAGGESETIFRRTLRAGDYWRNPVLAPVGERLERHHVSLEAFESTGVRLSFRSHQLLPDSAAPLRVVWANPLVRTRRSTPLPNVVLICLDTLRHDRVIGGSRDQPEILTPAIRELAADGVLFSNAISQSPWTLPSVASVLTGLTPSRHGAGNLLGSLEDPEDVFTLQQTMAKVGERTKAWRNQSVSHVYGLLPSAVRTLPEHLAGTHESYFVNSKNGWLKAAHLDRRFDASNITGDDARAARFGSMWTQHRADSLFLIYYHLMYVHDWPQTHLRQDIDHSVAKSAYDAGVMIGDQTIGDILHQLRTLGLYDSSLIVFWSDHGEHLWDPGWEIQGHGNSLSEVLLRVPLVIKYPGNAHAGTVVDDLVRLRDIFPTVLATMELPPEPEKSDPLRAQAVDLAEVIAGSRKIEIAFSEFGSFSKGLHSVQRGRYRLVTEEGVQNDRLLDIIDDRFLDEPLGADEQNELEELTQILESYLRDAKSANVAAEALELDEADVATLKALGYLQ